MTDRDTLSPRAVELLEEATNAPANTLRGDGVLRELEGWDSMGMVMFIGLVQRELGIELSVYDLHESRTVADLAARVRAKGAA
jgi:acyl carrier protein